MSSPTPTSTRALVHGLGVSGLAAARLLRRSGRLVLGADRRDRAALELGALAHDPGFELLTAEPTALPAGVDLVVASPGVPSNHPLLESARGRGVVVVGELELAYRAIVARDPTARFLAITGSNGKSTTTAMVGHLLASAGISSVVCGNIGTPLADCVEGPDGRVFVVEVSSFQLETVSTFHAHGAAVLNLAPDHLDRHGDLEGYARVKGRIFERQGADDVCVVGADEPWIASLPSAGRRRMFSTQHSVDDGCALVGDVVVETGPGSNRVMFAAGDVPLPGRHNLENAMAAALLAQCVGVELAAIGPALRTFAGLPHRLELVATLGGVRYIDDSKATNVAAAVRSIAGFPGTKVHAILGGRAKQGDDLELLATTAAAHATTALLIGEASDSFAAALAGAGVEAILCGTLHRAVTEASTRASAGDVVLLAPAAASYDQYRNYIDRGQHFRNLVGRLAVAPTGGHEHG